MMRQLRPISGTPMRSFMSTPSGKGSGTLAKVNASGWNARPRVVLVFAAPWTLTAPPLVGDAEAFWNGPLVMMPLPSGPAICNVALPEPSDEALAVSTHCARAPVEVRHCGLTAKQPAKVTTSPRLSRSPADAVQPVVVMLDPVWFAALIVGVPP